MQLVDKTVLVTGATGGIGSELCRQLAAIGVKLVMTAMNPAQLQALHAELGASHVMVAADIATDAGRQNIVQSCTDASGIDAVINLAGILNFSMFAGQNAALVSKTFEVNTLAPILLLQQLLPQLFLKPEARILNVGSIFGSIGHPGFAVYCASKAAIKTFSEAMARELADTTVSVAYLAPRTTRTGLNNDKVRALNAALGNKEDPPELVAKEICDMLAGKQSLRFMGWPEKLFVYINAVMPSLVHKALAGKLPLIKKFTH